MIIICAAIINRKAPPAKPITICVFCDLSSVPIPSIIKIISGNSMIAWPSASNAPAYLLRALIVITVAVTGPGCIAPEQDITNTLIRKSSRFTTSPGLNYLLADYFYEDTFLSFAVEFAVEDLFPGPEIKLAICDSDDHLPAHYAALQVGVGVVLKAVMSIL